MNIYCISDTHGDSISVPADTDILIHCGDFSNSGSKEEAKEFFKMVGDIDLPKERKIVIAGNHDKALYNCQKNIINDYIINDSCTYLRNSSTVVEGVKIYGSPYIPTLKNWAFYLPNHALKENWDNIPNDTDILVTHCPPYGAHDVIKYNGNICSNNLGCEHLANKITNGLPNLKYSLFGHIHECGGEYSQKGNTTYINCARKGISFKYGDLTWEKIKG